MCGVVWFLVGLFIGAVITAYILDDSVGPDEGSPL